tara:strand:- start:9968 stop:10228 length:261 start_codon:yes stop_codon:yes gene_type:complete
MGAHSNPSLHTQNSTVDLTDHRDLVLSRDERGYLKEMLHTYRHMFAEVMTAQKFNTCSDMVKRQQFHELQKNLGSGILEKIRNVER